MCVANAGWSTFQKARSDVTQHREQKDSSMAPGLPTKRLQMTIDQAGSADEASFGDKEVTFFRLVKSYVAIVTLQLFLLTAHDCSATIDKT
jgi:hypothetical protein